MARDSALPVTDAEMERLLDKCGQLPAAAGGYVQDNFGPYDDYVTNVLLTVLDLQMHNVAVDKAIRHYWQQELHDQIASQVQDRAADGPVEFQLCFRVSSVRNWSRLWKPVIDSLGSILGDGARPFHPHDDRVVRLALHRMIDDDTQWDVGVGVW